jgi:hypothetical protein
MLDAVTRLQFNTVETIWRPTTTNVGMEDDPEKILPKYVGRKDLFFFLFVKESRTGERPT